MPFGFVFVLLEVLENVALGGIRSFWRAKRAARVRERVSRRTAEWRSTSIPTVEVIRFVEIVPEGASERVSE